MSEILTDLGLDPEDISWQDLALCEGMNNKSKDDPQFDPFYNNYETSDEVAKNVDEMCLRCPVMKECGLEGMSNGEYGVWGGVYWNGAGKPDLARNQHKTQEVWDRIAQRMNE